MKVFFFCLEASLKSLVKILTKVIERRFISEEELELFLEYAGIKKYFVVYETCCLGAAAEFSSTKMNETEGTSKGCPTLFITSSLAIQYNLYFLKARF